MNIKRLLFALGIMSAVQLSCLGKVITVDDDEPADFNKIQDAINDAEDRDIIILKDGLYVGLGNRDLQWNSTLKHLMIKSENGPLDCIIDCENNGRGFILDAGQDNRDIIEGLKIINGKATSVQIPDSRDCHGGGAILCDGTSPQIKNCILENNFARSSPWGNLADGGAIDVIGGGSPYIAGCLIKNNEATHTGGGIHVYGSNPIIEGNYIVGNRCDGCYGGGGVSYIFMSAGWLMNNVIAENTSYYYSQGGYGGGILCMNSNPRIINNTVASNTTWKGANSGEGGGLRIRGKPYPLMINCIFWGNQSKEGLEDLDFQYTDVLPVRYCNVGVGLEGVDTGNSPGNISIDPLFIDASQGDYHLHYNSPCVNAGDPCWIPDPCEFDIDGQARLRLGRIDLGADETGSHPVDFNEDGGVDTVDFALFNTAWLTTDKSLGWEAIYDVSEPHDEVVNLKDYAVLAKDWLWQAGWYQ